MFYGQSRRATQMCQNAGAESAAVMLTYASGGWLQKGSDWRGKERKKGSWKTKTIQESIIESHSQLIK